MQTDSGASFSRRSLPSLVQICQRVAVNNIDSITDIGGLSYDLVQPILAACGPDALVQLEDNSPELKFSTSDLWETLCRREFPLPISQLDKGQDNSLSDMSWRERYYIIRERVQDRLDALTSRMKQRRQEEEDKKKEREVKITTRLPPGRKTFWGQNYQPKTLLQKTKTEAKKLQKSMYTRALPPIVAGKPHRVLPTASNSMLLPPPTSEGPSRVTVNTVRRPSNGLLSSSNSGSLPRSDSGPSASGLRSIVSTAASAAGQASPSAIPPSSTASEVRTVKSPPKRQPKNSLFMPKHRAYSQLSQGTK